MGAWRCDRCCRNIIHISATMLVHPPPCLALRGASSRDVSKMEPPGVGRCRRSGFVPPGPVTGKPGIGGAAPAGGVRYPALGRPWPAVRPHYGGLPRNGCTRREARGGGSCPAKGVKSVPQARPGSTAPGTEKPRWSAERRPRLARGAERKDWMRRSALRSPRTIRGDKRSAPRPAGISYGAPAPVKNRGDGARLHSSLTIESGMRGRENIRRHART